MANDNGFDLNKLLDENTLSKEDYAKSLLQQVNAKITAKSQVAPTQNRLGKISANNLTSGMTQTEISQVFGVNKATVKRWADKSGNPFNKANPYTLDQIKQIVDGKTPTDKAQTIYKGISDKEIIKSYNMTRKEFNSALSDLGIAKKKQYNQEEMNLITGNTHDRVSYNEVAHLINEDYDSLKQMLDDLSDGYSNVGPVGWTLLDLYHSTHGKDLPIGTVLEAIKEVDKEAYQKVVTAYTTGGL